MGEVGLVVVEVVHLKELTGAFAGVGGEDGWVGADEAVDVEVLGCGAHDGGADAEDGGLARGAEPEVAVLHEEVDAVFFEGDGERGVFGDALEDFYVFDVELVAAGGAGVGTDFAGDDEAGFEGELFEGVEDFFGDGGFGDDALDGAGAVAEDGEEELARGAEVVEPAAEGDGFAFVLGEGGYGGDGCGGGAGELGHFADLPCSRLPDVWVGRGGCATWKAGVDCLACLADEVGIAGSRSIRRAIGIR